MRLRLLATSLVAVVTTALFAAPAEAAAKPAKVGLVSIVGTSTYVSGGRTYAKVKISWPKARKATKYQVFVSSSAARVLKVRKPTKTVRGTSVTISKLGRHRQVWFQVRAVNGSRPGPRSSRVARITPLASPQLSAATSPVISMMTYNVCSNACSKWTTRMPLVVKQIDRIKPDVLAVQEASQWKAAEIPGYLEARCGKDNRIFYREDVFEQVERPLSEGQETEDCAAPSSPEAAADQPNEPNEPAVAPLVGELSIPGKNVPWTLLRHRRTGQEVAFLGFHLAVDSNGSKASYRASQTTSAITKLDEDFKAWGLEKQSIPTVLIGDFNTNRSRAGNSTLETVMNRNGYFDSYEQARLLINQHFNSANPAWATLPRIGVTWGDHVDKIWIRPTKTRVHLWMNAGEMAGGRWKAPLPTDHHPVLIRAQVS